MIDPDSVSYVSAPFLFLERSKLATGATGYFIVGKLYLSRVPGRGRWTSSCYTQPAAERSKSTCCYLVHPYSGTAVIIIKVSVAVHQDSQARDT